jgi:antitoxin component of MazEF toxin-antitoxin module
MSVFESRRKVQVFGGSLVLTLPAFFVRANEVEKGAVMKVYYGLDGVLVVSRIDDPEVTSERLKVIIDKLEKKATKREGPLVKA